jgi:uncharacterized DUF497 family protein
VTRFRFGDLEFSWDDRKARVNSKKHGVTFREAATVFADPLARIYDDPDHSDDEQRFLLVGHSFAGRVLLVVHAENPDMIRIISAPRARPSEREEHDA